jgi:hypothetical protein
VDDVQKCIFGGACTGIVAYWSLMNLWVPLLSDPATFGIAVCMILAVSACTTTLATVTLAMRLHK